MVDVADLGGARTVLIVPMLNEDKLLGAISIYRQEVRPFTDKQIELVKNFAAQAVIAIENTRLLNELRQRTDDLSELLEQQTATAEVLKVISSSPGELQPVFSAHVGKRRAHLRAKFGTLSLWEGDSFRIGAAQSRASRRCRNCRADRCRPGPNAPAGSHGEQQAGRPGRRHYPGSRLHRARCLVVAREQGGYRTILAVPMLKEDELIGVIVIYRRRFGRSPTSRSIWCRTSPPRR